MKKFAIISSVLAISVLSACSLLTREGDPIDPAEMNSISSVATSPEVQTTGQVETADDSVIETTSGTIQENNGTWDLLIEDTVTTGENISGTVVDENPTTNSGTNIDLGTWDNLETFTGDDRE